MTPRSKRPTPASGYSLQFGTATFLLVAGTLVLVLFVLPQRYVLSAGFRESGASFPTPATPFVPVDIVPVAARLVPQPPQPIPPGPAELFWAEVVPLLEAGRYAAALPAFERYLGENPADTDARREYSITLLAAGQIEAAVPVLRDVAAASNDFETRLLLARTLRELGRTEEAAAEYAALSEQRPADVQLALEWARALAWDERYAAAIDVLTSALDREPEAVEPRIELARAYFALGDLEAAAAALSGIDEETLAAAGGSTLRDAVAAALVVPEGDLPPATQPTLLEQAVTARVQGDFALAADRFAAALAAEPASAETWQAFADFLEYELGDFEGARDALLEVERLTELDPNLQYRLAQLEIWTDRNPQAVARLRALLDQLDSTPVVASGDAEVVSRADVQALLGDLHRWAGDRVEAARRYKLALAHDGTNERAPDGLGALRAEVDRQVVEVEAPRLGGTAYSLADTDDFLRVDLAGEWTETNGDWVWGGRLGNRWLEGIRFDGGRAASQGAYVELETARWWRWGTVRTGFQFGAERVRAGLDYSFGGTLRHRVPSGESTELRYAHGPAYPLAGTLQSVIADVAHDRLTLTHSRFLSDRWTFVGALDGARLRANPDSIGVGEPRSTTRFQGDLSVGRRMSGLLTLGVAARSLVFTNAAPLTPSGRPLFWDPRSVVTAGPFVRLDADLARDWAFTGRVSPGLARIDERRSAGIDAVPHFSAEAGIRREGSRFWTAFDVFYYQGQFDGYRTYGARLTLSARDFSSLTGAR